MPPGPVHDRPVPPDRETARSESALEWCFRNRETGAITIAQFPNIALGIVIVCFIAGVFVPDDTTAHTVIRWVGLAALLWWSLDELIRGVNPWRRVLGTIVGVLTIVSIVQVASGG